MSQYNDPAEAGPHTHKCGLEQEVETPPEQTSKRTVQEPQPSATRTNDPEVVGFEEVAPNSENKTLKESDTPTETDEEDDLIITKELTRVNSFDFVAVQAQENESHAALTDLVNQRVRYEATSVIEAPVLAMTNNRSSTRRYTDSRGNVRYVEEIEMVEQCKGPRVDDLEAAPGESGKKKGGWRESISLW